MNHHILVQLSEVVISYVYIMNIKYIRRGIVTLRDLRPAC